jgi:hypothetical protein
MHLLTWHGSVVCEPDAEGVLTHAPVSADRGQTPMRFDAAQLAAHGGSLRHPDLGSLRLEPAGRPGALNVQRDGFYLCASLYSSVLAFDREQASLWESFLPISAADLADLQHILGHPWIEHATRRVWPRRLTRAEAFTLDVGPVSIDLAGGLAAHIARRNGAGKPVALRANGDEEAALFIAEPRSSALLHTELWPVRARRSAEVLALAAHRQIKGTEPEQDVFEQITSALQAKGGAPGLSDVLEDMLTDRKEPASAAPWDASEGGDVAPADLINAWAQREVAPWLLRPASRSRVHLLCDELNDTTEWGFVFSIANRQATLREKPYRNGRSAFFAGRARMYLAFFDKVAASLPEDFATTFCMGLDDALGARFDAPVFCFQKLSHASSILLPDIDFLIDFHAGSEVQDRLSYELKMPKAVFAGSTTGAWITLEVAENFASPRLRAARYFQDSETVDFRLPRITQCQSQAAEDFLAAQPFCQKEALSWQEQFRYRFIISIDGNGATCSRVAIALHSNAVLLRYSSDHQLFYFGGLQPWLHYVPVASDRDVEQVIALEQGAPELFRQIAENGRRFAKTYLTAGALIAYTARVLQFYEASFVDSAVGLSALAPERLRSDAATSGFHIVAHQQNVGDISGNLDEWIGTPGSTNALEGFAIVPGGMLNADGLSVQAVLQSGGLNEPAPAGVYCGTRGQNIPVYGLCIRTAGIFAERFQVLYEAVFTDGTQLGPMVAGVICRAPSGAPLEALRLTIVARSNSKA